MMPATRLCWMKQRGRHGNASRLLESRWREPRRIRNEPQWCQWSAMAVFVGEKLDDKCGAERRRWLARLGQAQHQHKVLTRHARGPAAQNNRCVDAARMCRTACSNRVRETRTDEVDGDVDATALVDDRRRWCCPRSRDGNWTRGYGYPRVSYPVDMDSGLKSYPWIQSGRVPEIRRVGYG
jgi:hypothetical protein